MKQRLLALYSLAFLLFLITLFSACSQNKYGWVEGYVADKKGGDPVAGVLVTDIVANMTAITDENGYFRLRAPVGERALVFTKKGYATTRIEGVRVAEEKATYQSTILLEAFDPELPLTPPQIEIKDLETSGDLLKVTFAVSVAEPDRNGLVFTDVSLGTVGGNSGHLNGTVRHERLFGYDGNSTTVELSIAGFSGLVSLHIVSYDVNNNRTEVIRHLELPTTQVEVSPPAPQNLDALAITFGDLAVFGTMSTSPLKEKLIALKEGNLKLSSPKTSLVKPLADERLEKAIYWVELTFNYPADTVPDHFEIWRKRADEKDFRLIARATPWEMQQDVTTYLFRDASPGIAPGVELIYKVVAVLGDKRKESAITSTTPLPVLKVKALEPSDHATGIPLNPVYKMSLENSADLNAVAVIVLDRVQADFSVAYSSPLLVLEGEDGVVDPFDLGGIPHGLVQTDAGYVLADTPLYPHHTYDWQPVAITLDLDEAGERILAVSFGADFFNLLGEGFGLPLGVRDGPVNTFTTGAE